MRNIGSVAIILVGIIGCAANNGGADSLDDTAASALRYHCPVTGEDPEGPDLWLEIQGREASISHDATFATTSNGTLDSTYKPTLRTNMDRFRGFADWNSGATTTLYVNKGLETSGGNGDIFVDTAASRFTETVYGCTAIVGSTCAWAGTAGELATFDLDGEPGNEANVAAASVTGGLSASGLTRSSALTSTKASGSLSASHWGTGTSADGARYFTFTVTPGENCSLSLEALRVELKASSTGPQEVDMATSVDGFATHTSPAPGTSSPTTPLSVSSSAPIEIRIYGYKASSGSGTLRLQGAVTLSGQIH